MAKDTPTPSATENAISIVGPGMRVVGDCDTDGTLRIEGTVQGTVRAGKAVVVGKDGVVNGDVITQDAIIGGRVNGSVLAESRLELQTTCVVEGEIRARRIKLDEGGRLNGTVHVGEVKAPAAPHAAVGSTPREATGGQGAPGQPPQRPAVSG